MAAALKPGLRPYLASDAPILAAIFRASIEDLTAEDYDEDQREAWAAGADDEAAFGAGLAGCLTLVATVEGEPVGFASLKGADLLHMLFVHPAVAGQGVGAALYDAIETIARARGAERLRVEASDTARAFFERRGFAARTRNVVPKNGAWLANTTLEKRLAPATGEAR